MILAATHKFKGVSSMLKIQEIREIIKLIEQSDIDEFIYEHEGSKLELKKNNTTTQVVQAVQEQSVQQVPVTNQQPVVAVQGQAAPSEPLNNNAENLHKITSPMVGTFYQSPSPDNPAYVQVGSKVKADTVVCIVEAMKLFNEIEADVEGEIVEVLVKDGELVEYGQPLFLVKPL